jgi:thioredoxin-related protein
MKFKSALLVGLLLLIASKSFAQVDFYRTKIDARKNVASALIKAKSEGKNVIIMFGGSWSAWSKLFNETCSKDPDLMKMYHNNYKGVPVEARENKDMLIEYGSPNRFGYPVFVVINSDGKLIHTQDSALLEEGDGYNKEKIMTFLKKWTVANTK